MKLWSRQTVRTRQKYDSHSSSLSVVPSACGLPVSKVAYRPDETNKEKKANVRYGNTKSLRLALAKTSKHIFQWINIMPVPTRKTMISRFYFNTHLHFESGSNTLSCCQTTAIEHSVCIHGLPKTVHSKLTKNYSVCVIKNYRCFTQKPYYQVTTFRHSCD